MNSPVKESDRGREIGRLTRTYAQNRSLCVAVSLLIFLTLFAAISLLSYYAGETYRSENWGLFGVCVTALVPALTFVIYMSIPRWGGRQIESLTRRLYPEGNVSIDVPQQKGRQRVGLLVAILFGVCVLGSVFDEVPPKYVQPVSALYVVPFLVGIKFLMGPVTSYVSLLWPLLYGLHALLIVAGVPIVFTGSWEPLNIALPMVGYGLIASLLGHAYNRHALHKLRQITQADGRDTEGASQQ